ncbi:MAG: hypothetical protein L3K10_04815 [Thermoplasmata archaeon]|nr:hypothetical protein [Thermoplasmata archaeon]
MAEPATAEGPPRRRGSWSLRSIVEDVAGVPIEELQEPGRPVHPYLEGRLNRPTVAPRPTAGVQPYDPVGHISPPLVGSIGREFHGPEYEHHQETLDRHAAPNGGRAPGPLNLPERLYLHYLLLHMDRLSDTALRYLRTAIDEEMGHRSPPQVAPRPASNAPSAAPRPPVVQVTPPNP